MGNDILIGDNCNEDNSCCSDFGYSYNAKDMTYKSSEARSHLAGAFSFSV